MLEVLLTLLVAAAPAPPEIYATFCQEWELAARVRSDLPDASDQLQCLLKEGQTQDCDLWRTLSRDDRAYLAANVGSFRAAAVAARVWGLAVSSLRPDELRRVDADGVWLRLVTLRLKLDELEFVKRGNEPSVGEGVRVGQHALKWVGPKFDAAEYERVRSELERLLRQQQGQSNGSRVGRYLKAQLEAVRLRAKR